MVISLLTISVPLCILHGTVYKRTTYTYRAALKIVDFDHGTIGAQISQTLLMQNNQYRSVEKKSRPVWRQSFGEFRSAEEVQQWVRLHGWGALVINAGASEQLERALQGAESETHNPKALVTFFLSAGHQPIMYQVIESAAAPDVNKAMQTFAVGLIQNQTAFEQTPTNSLAQLVTQPIGYQIVNVAPYAFNMWTVAFSFGILVGTLCTESAMVEWKLRTLAFFLRVKLHHLWLATLAVFLLWAAYFGMFAALALAAFEGPGYKQTALPFTAAPSDDFKTTENIAFYLRHQAFTETILQADPALSQENSGEMPHAASPYTVVSDSVYLNGHTLVATVQHDSTKVPLRVEVIFLKNGTVRVRAQEENPLLPRYDDTQKYVLRGEGNNLGYALASDLKHYRELVDGVKVHTVRYTNEHSAFSVRITEDPWSLTYLENNKPIIELNSKGHFHLEHLRPKPDPETIGDDVSGEWKETFLPFTDSKTRGPESFGMDINFIGFEHVYGIPGHATPLSLKTTNNEKDGYNMPYRLWNLDVFGYELDDPISLYGSIPFMVAHNIDTTVGVFWLNAAETLVDITREKRSNVDNDLPVVNTHWVSEAGVMDVFLMPGPSVADLYRQYTSLIEPTPLPREFALGYHMCRWSYLDQEDVLTVSEKMHEHDIPYDAIWLDIDYTDGMRYFTWDYSKFPDPVAMQKQLAHDGHKLVTIIDPHVKRDSSYRVWKEGNENGYFIKNNTSTKNYDGWCWPKESNWVDYLNPEASKWYSKQYHLDKYLDSTADLFIWNDMNEPSIFRMPEGTAEKNTKHYGDWEHRQVHNLYGMLNHRATFEGMLTRESPRKRPFILSRSYFAGSQRYGAIWTGDNIADWGYMRAAVQMVLSNNIAGMHFSGADVGGFVGNPEPELLIRWYQLGIWHPFFRTHSKKDTKRREPWLFGEPYLSIMRKAICERYRMLPYWYTLFREASLTGMPIVRPMWMEFPKDLDLFAKENTFMVGSSIMVAPSLDSDLTKPIDVTFPSQENWYNMYTHASYFAPIKRRFVTDLAQTLVYVRGGSIIPTRERQRRSSAFMKQDPFTLYVYVSRNDTASGKLYIDDGESYDYEKGAFIEREFVYAEDKLISRSSPFTMESAEHKAFLDKMNNVCIERVVMIGLTSQPTVAIIRENGAEREILLEYGNCRTGSKCVIRDPTVCIGNDWEIALN
ncbi:glycosyl hydrolases family 31-domain-containing protein [Coemansia spiralis]|nr:glycosyl hydrolases family 31-domain-containing protein [Coemansia spiralis]